MNFYVFSIFQVFKIIGFGQIFSLLNYNQTDNPARNLSVLYPNFKSYYYFVYYPQTIYLMVLNSYAPLNWHAYTLVLKVFV